MVMIRRTVTGFSIVEAAVMLIVGSILLASYSSIMAKRMQADTLNTTKDRMTAIKTAIAAYFDANGKLPCPASLTAGIDTASFGREVSTTCTGGAIGGTFEVDGRGSAANPKVRIGAVPVRALDLPDDMVADAWGSRFFYAVTEKLATPYTFQGEEGAIYIRDKNGNDIRTPAGTAHYVLLSTGPNRKGGYTMTGAAPASVCPGAGSESENCNLNAYFVNDLTTATSSVKTGYDDLIIFSPDNRVTASDPLPSGMVLPFRLAACPTGWSDYVAGRGRVIVGVGTYSDPASPPSQPAWGFAVTYNRGDTGGLARVTLTQSNIPSHRHAENLGFTADIDATGWGELIGPTLVGSNYYAVQPKGGSQPFDNRQPYLALRYCRKD